MDANFKTEQGVDDDKKDYSEHRSKELKAMIQGRGDCRAAPPRSLRNVKKAGALSN